MVNGSGNSVAAEPSVRVVTTLGLAQTLAWGSTYYLPAILAVPMARDLGVSTATVFGAFSVALILSALLGPYAGRLIDGYGGRPLLAGTSVIFALGLAGLAAAQGSIGLFAAWLILGIGMGSGLYEAAFSTLVALYGDRSRGAITGITLIAGFASTIAWPLSTFLDVHFGWRAACLTWAVLHLTLGLVLNLSLPKLKASNVLEAEAEAAGSRNNLTSSTKPNSPSSPSSRSPLEIPDSLDSPVTSNSPQSPDTPPNTVAAPRRWTLYALAFVFAATWFTSTAMAAHLPRLLQAGGATLATAVFVGALIGPAQVAARLMEFALQRRAHPLLSARVAASLHPIGALIFGLFGAPAAALFGILHGAGNGIMTIAKGTLPLVIFGPSGYGQRQGVLMVPARIAQALAPWLFGICLDAFGVKALWMTSGLGIAAMLALFFIPLSARGK
ncbi:MFS transporter [Pusillimonas sp. ANT_WB101]|uniref:MFS transporter n=1 Tax=Pusillimonas sp. ANT_WB101 TaxID=2597356 RepID=UPI0011ED41A8|nr:MFS transporter [Pusillimonas sp. ANT_WB101]KAA0889999.1 MFS transporter [Pusillimonas sp. ANT_WB101]